MAQSIKNSGIKPSGRLVFKSVVNAETLQAYSNSISASESLLGKSGAKALNLRGKTPTDMYYEMENGWLNLVINF